MRALLVVLFVVAAAACGNATKLDARTEAVMHATVVATGSSGSVRFADRYDWSTGPDGVVDCSTAASDGNTIRRTFLIATPGTMHAPLYFSIETRGFSGPGVYRDAAIRLDSVAAVIAHQTIDFSRTSTSHVAVTLHDDGSGSASFSGYRAAQGMVLAARVKWTCTTKAVLWPKES
jgi:hypothetical protein